VTQDREIFHNVSRIGACRPPVAENAVVGGGCVGARLDAALGTRPSPDDYPDLLPGFNGMPSALGPVQSTGIT